MQIPNSDGFPAAADSTQAMFGQEPLHRLTKRPMATAMRPAALSAKPNLLGLLMALQRRWLLAVSLGLLLASVVAGVVWVSRPITFTARTTLHVNSTPYRLLYEIPDGRGDFNNYQRAQIALVRSRLVLNSALRDPKLEKLSLVQQQEDQVVWLEKEIQADFSIAPEILRIAMTGMDAKALPLIVEAVRKAYLLEIVQKENRAKQARLDQLTRYFAETDGSLRDKRVELKRIARNLGGQNTKLLAARQEFSAQNLREMQSELLKRHSELRTTQLDLQKEQARAKAIASLTIPNRTIEEHIKLDPVVLRLQKEAAQHDADVAAWKDRSPAPEKEAGYQKAVTALEAAKAGLAKRRDELRPTVVEELREKFRNDQQVLLAQLDNRVSYLKEMKAVLDGEIEVRSKEDNATKLEVVDLEWLQDEIAQLDTVNKEFSRQMQVLQVEIQAPPRVTELEDPMVVPAQTESSRLRLAGGAGLGTFAAVLFGIAFLEFRLRRVTHADEVVQGLNMKLVGALPSIPRRALAGRSSAAHNAEWQNRLTEAVDAIRTTLLSAARFEGLRRVMVTSAVGGEGKTLLSCHLAISLARAGCKTLLIDGDLRRPSVHKLFDLPLASGLSELLRGEVSPADMTNAGPVAGLSVITAGQSDSRAIQTLARDRVGEVLQQLSENYEFIVIDSAPVLPIADSQLIGQHADGVVLSVMRDVSRLPSVYAACERLNMLHIRILGAVVNGMPGNYYQGSTYYSSAPPAAATPVTPEEQTNS
jgi:succinoglycan biosynthesis transport protein ExoP